MTERWLPIQNYEGLYEISDYGSVKSLPRIKQRNDGTILPVHGGIRVPEDHIAGYYRIYLYNKNGIRARHFIHRLVAQAFIENPKDKPIVNHKDRNKHNNTLANLEWVTGSENNLHWHADNREKAALVTAGLIPEEGFDPADLPF